MRKISLFLAGLAISCVMFSCESENESNQPENEITADVISQLNELGFNTVDYEVYQVGDVVIVENDIHLTVDQIEKMSGASEVPTVEHYHTDNLVTGLPRTISVFMSSSFLPQYFDALDAAIARYNTENLTLTFQRVTSATGADLQINPSPFWYQFFGILGSAGFPTDAGDPFGEILITEAFYDDVTDLGNLTTVIAHEIGHCIGFRHTDYADRSFSCGGSPDDEGAGADGANYIPGTPTGGDPGSWMLACSDGSDRPFNSNDKIALDFLY